MSKKDCILCNSLIFTSILVRESPSKIQAFVNRYCLRVKATIPVSLKAAWWARQHSLHSPVAHSRRADWIRGRYQR